MKINELHQNLVPVRGSTGKTICYQFPCFTNPQSEISLFLSLLHGHLLTPEGSRPCCGSPTLAGEALHNCRHSTQWKVPIRLESTDAIFIWTSVRTWLDDRFGLILAPTFASLWQLDEVCLQHKENGRDKTSIKACGNPERFAFPNRTDSCTDARLF